MVFTFLSSLKTFCYSPGALGKWKVIVLLSLTSLLIIYVTLQCRTIVPVVSIAQLRINQSINQEYQTEIIVNQDYRPEIYVNHYYRPKTKFIFMNKGLCASTAVGTSYRRSALIVVLSARKNFNHRKLARQTYGSVKNANNVQILALIFMLAKPGAQFDNAADIKMLQEEREQFGDTIMGDFIDDYRNLTLKTIMAYEWITEHCRQAELVVKTDDDVLVNIFQLTKQLDSLSPADMASSNIWGSIHYNEGTVKDAASRFYASPVDFPNGTFPEHCAGVGYITTFGVIKRILDDISSSFLGRVSTHEDVFMTGLVPIHINSKLNTGHPSHNADPIRLVNLPYLFSYTFEDGKDDKDDFMKNFVKNMTMQKEIENFNTFRQRNSKRVFFLISHNESFELIYRQLWEIIKKTFST